MKAVIIICTRPESSRLPGKVFMNVAGVPAIEHILYRLIGCGLPVILAVPSGCKDYELTYQRCEQSLNLNMFYGDPVSPLHRMAACVKAIPDMPKWVIRITHDDILVDQQTMLDLLDVCDSMPEVGYGVSPSIVDGAGVEIIRTENLLRAAENHPDPTEFISYFVKSEPYGVIKTLRPRESVCRPYRLTMDYYADWLVLDTVLERVGRFASLDTVCSYLDAHPWVMSWNRQPLVTFYTCVRNGEKFLRQAMQSVLANDGIDLEYIVVDDGSTDDTAAIVSEFGHDPRIRFIKNEQSLGLASASNMAIQKARGRYLMRVDADDVLLPHAAKTMIDCIQKENAGAVYAGYYEMVGKETVLSKVVDPRTVHHAGCALFDHRMINEIRFTEGLRHFDGADLHKRLAAKNMPVAYVGRPLWLYRRHDNNLSNSDRDERIRTRQNMGLDIATATSLGPSMLLK